METKIVRIEIKFTRTTLAVLLGLALLLAGLWVVGGALAQQPEPEVGGEGETAALGALAASGVVSPAISYQGRLTDENGSPLSGDYEMIFQFWNAQDGRAQVGDTITRTAVTVEGGLFNVELEVNPDDFNGQELWLGVTVDGEPLTPRQAILPAPYALSLRPGAVISDTDSYVKLNRYFKLGPYSYKYGVYVEARNATLTYGLYGDGDYAGVYGKSDSGYGVYGDSPNGTAIYGNGDVRQSLDDNGLVKAAVYAKCQDESPSIYRFFNNVNSQDITIAGGASNGQCTIDFNFAISDRYWGVMAASSGVSRVTTCRWVPATDTDLLDCSCYTETGAGVDCSIMVLIY